MPAPQSQWRKADKKRKDKIKGSEMTTQDAEKIEDVTLWQAILDGDYDIYVRGKKLTDEELQRLRAATKEIEKSKGAA